MKSLLFTTTMICLALLWCHPGGIGAQAPDRTIHVVPVSGEITPTMAAFLKRALKEIEERGAALAIVEIDTFGGRVDSALAMVETLTSQTSLKTIAYVKTKAISAGALIALACDELYMRRSTTIGDCAPIAYSQEGPKELGEKFQSPLRAQMRSLARRNGYPVALAEAMVTQGMEVLAIEIDGETRFIERTDLEEMDEEEKGRITAQKVIVSATELLTMDDVEAVELRFSKESVTDLKELMTLLALGDHGLERIERTWSEGFAGIIGTLSPILMLIGLGAIYTEIKSPGFGVPGILGIICLALVFLNQYIVGLADYTELLFLLAGIILFGFEMFVIPGFGIAGLAGLAFLAIALVLALQDFVLPNPSLPWQKEMLIRNAAQVLGSMLGGFLLALFTLRFVLPKFSRIIQGPYLDTTLEDAHADSIAAASVAVGDTGTALSLLRPAGRMKIGTQFVDVITRGEYIEKGTPIRVDEIDGNRIIVVKSIPTKEVTGS